MDNHRENNKKTHNAQQEVIQTQNNFAVDAIVIDDDENDDVIIITPPSSPAHGNIVTIDLTDSSDVPDGSPPNETDQLEGAAGPKTEEEKNADLECPICLQICVHPTRLPCGHIFCFLCIKGVAYKSKRCAMCRRDIPEDYMDHPDLINGAKDIKETRSHENGYQWFYEGRNGWWQYDDRTSQDIEEAYKKGDKSCTILVAGYVYVVDLETMLQQRQNDPTRCRRVKRDLATIPKKGVAGLRIEGNTVITDTNFANTMHQSRQQQQSQQQHLQQQLPQQHQQPQQQQSQQTLQQLSSSASQQNGDAPIRNLHLPFDYGMRLTANAISTIAVTDAAIRIASDIIGSTLAHADEVTRGGIDVIDVSGLAAADATNAADDVTNSSNLSGEQCSLASATIAAAAASSSTPTSAIEPGNLPPSHHAHNTDGTDYLDTFHELLPVVEEPESNLFEQTLNDFQALTMRNIFDSSDEEDELMSRLSRRRMRF